MCCFKSGEAVNITDSEVEVYVSAKTESHADIRAEHGIREDRGPMDRAHTPIALHPVTGIDPEKPEMWELTFGAGRPDWWTDDMTAQATRQMLAFVAEHHFRRGRFLHPGDVRLPRLTTWPPNTPFRCGGNAQLHSLTAWGARSPFRCGRNAQLPSLINWGARSHFRCRGDANLLSLRAWPANTPFHCEYGVWDGEHWQKPDEWLRQHTRHG